MNEIGRKVAHAKRLINAGEPLTGDILEFALGLMPDLPPTHKPSEGDQVWLDIERKLKAGETLDDYEYHLLVEVVFLHVRLQAEAMENEDRADDRLS